MNTPALSNDYAAGPLHLMIDVPATASQPGLRFEVHLDEARAALVRVAANHLDLPLAEFLQAALDGRLTVEFVPLPADKLARWRQRTAKTLAKVSPAKQKQAAKLAAARGYAIALDLLTAEAWRDFEEVSVGIGHQRQRFPRTLWSRVEEFIGLDQLRHQSAPPRGVSFAVVGQEPLQALAA